MFLGLVNDVKNYCDQGTSSVVTQQQQKPNDCEKKQIMDGKAFRDLILFMNNHKSDEWSEIDKIFTTVERSFDSLERLHLFHVLIADCYVRKTLNGTKIHEDRKLIQMRLNSLHNNVERKRKDRKSNSTSTTNTITTAATATSTTTTTATKEKKKNVDTEVEDKRKYVGKKKSTNNKDKSDTRRKSHSRSKKKNENDDEEEEEEEKQEVENKKYVGRKKSKTDKTKKRSRSEKESKSRKRAKKNDIILPIVDKVQQHHDDNHKDDDEDDNKKSLSTKKNNGADSKQVTEPVVSKRSDDNKDDDNNDDDDDDDENNNDNDKNKKHDDDNDNNRGKKEDIFDFDESKININEPKALESKTTTITTTTKTTTTGKIINDSTLLDSTNNYKENEPTVLSKKENETTSEESTNPTLFFREAEYIISLVPNSNGLESGLKLGLGSEIKISGYEELPMVNIENISTYVNPSEDKDGNSVGYEVSDLFNITSDDKITNDDKNIPSSFRSIFHLLKRILEFKKWLSCDFFISKKWNKEPSSSPNIRLTSIDSSPKTPFNTNITDSLEYRTLQKHYQIIIEHFYTYIKLLFSHLKYQSYLFDRTVSDIIEDEDENNSTNQETIYVFEELMQFRRKLSHNINSYGRNIVENAFLVETNRFSTSIKKGVGVLFGIISTIAQKTDLILSKKQKLNDDKKKRRTTINERLDYSIIQGLNSQYNFCGFNLARIIEHEKNRHDLIEILKKTSIKIHLPFSDNIELLPIYALDDIMDKWLNKGKPKDIPVILTSGHVLTTATTTTTTTATTTATGTNNTTTTTNTMPSFINEKTVLLDLVVMETFKYFCLYFQSSTHEKISKQFDINMEKFILFKVNNNNDKDKDEDKDINDDDNDDNKTKILRWYSREDKKTYELYELRNAIISNKYKNTEENKARVTLYYEDGWLPLIYEIKKIDEKQGGLQDRQTITVYPKLYEFIQFGLLKMVTKPPSSSSSSSSSSSVLSSFVYHASPENKSLESSTKDDDLTLNDSKIRDLIQISYARIFHKIFSHLYVTFFWNLLRLIYTPSIKLDTETDETVHEELHKKFDEFLPYSFNKYLESVFNPLSGEEEESIKTDDGFKDYAHIWMNLNKDRRKISGEESISDEDDNEGKE